MERRKFLAGISSAVAGSLAWPGDALSGFGIFQVNGPPLVNIPSGVAFQAIDGGPTYYGTNSFTVAAASRTWNNPAPGGPVAPFPAFTYAQGYDDPKFFPIGPYLSSMNSDSDANRWMTIGHNIAVSMQGPQAGQLDRLKNYGISLWMQYVEMGGFIANDRNPGSETDLIYTYDEPSTIDQAISVPAQGNATVTMTNASITGNVLTIAGTATGGHVYPVITPSVSYAYGTLTGSGITNVGVQPSLSNYQNNGTAGCLGCATATYFTTATSNVSNITITETAIAPLAAGIITGRALACAMQGASFMRFQNTGSITGNISSSFLFGNSYPAQDGRNRSLDAIGADFYWFLAAADNTVGGVQQQGSNMYDTSGASAQMTSFQCAKGPHYGNQIDYFRKMTTSASPPRDIPIYQYIDVSNSSGSVAYDTQGVEINWGAWATIIHGARAVVYFAHTSASSPSGCSGAAGGDNFQCAYMQAAQSATFTGTIAAGVLTTTSVITGILCPGMVCNNAGVSGVVVVLQQTNNFATPGKGSGTTFAVATVSGAGTVTGSMTFTQSNIGFGGAGASMSFASKGMVDCNTQTNTRIRDMAPVINSPFAVSLSALGPGSGYVTSTSPVAAYIFPSDTGIKNSFPPQTFTYGLAGSSGTLAASAIDCCAKLYSGSTYTTSAGDTIRAGFYIFATTRLEERNAPNISVSFTLNDPFATSITVLGESRSINFTSGQGTNQAVFSDTFDFAWTVRIYRVNH